MSYFDDYYSSDDEQDIYYHNYSVDYAKQILNGQFQVSSRLPYQPRRYSPKLLRVATLDHMPIRHQPIPQLHSIPKFQQQSPRPLPSLEQTSQELERRANRTTTTNNNPSTQDQIQPMTEQQLRQVQQQQQAFQQHLINMQNHLMEQQQQQQQQQPQPPPSSSSTPIRRNRFEKKSKTSYHSFDRDDDQDEIAQLIETDPYFAAAMEDFALTHGLIHSKTHSDDSSDQSIDLHHRRPRHHSSHSSSSSSSSSLTNITSPSKSSKNESILYRELHEIRRLIEDYIQNRQQYYPSGMSMDTHHRRRMSPPNPTKVLYQNVVDVVKQVMDRRSPSQRELPLKPSQIDPSLKSSYTKRPIIPPPSLPPPVPPPPLPSSSSTTTATATTTTFPNVSLPNINRRRSSQLSATPPLTNSIPVSFIFISLFNNLQSMNLF